MSMYLFELKKGEADDSGNDDTDDGYACGSGQARQPKRISPPTPPSPAAITANADSTMATTNVLVSSSATNRRNDLLHELLLELTTPAFIWHNQTSYLSELPAEVMLNIMKCMDDLSIYALAKASNRWKQLIHSTVDWKKFIRTRWPLFPLSDDDNSNRSNPSRIYDQL
jgi:hypothetical protein